MKAVWPVVILSLSAANFAVADSADSRDGVAWLGKMAVASNQLNYSGTFVYQHGGQSETSRIAHFVNPAGGVFEKLETLDGPVREVVRSNDQVTCYLPGAKTVLIEQRNARLLPALLPENLSGITESYVVRVGGRDRVAGHECQVIALEPRDNLRYGRQFCLEARSGLPLRVRTFNEKNDSVESFAFTQLRVGGRFDRDKVKSRYASRSRNWRVDRSALNITEKAVETGWVVNNRPAGFKKLMEVKRSIAGRTEPVAQIVFSDGLAAISVFIEPMPKERSAETTLSHQGAVNIYTRSYADRMVTVLGEAPAATVMQIANSLELRTSAAAK
ncbi:MAG TPA: MucB/RseB C-terminal domain-containing protein [Burkholderiales bacterium]|nr:MucB/RseB C-terminal domain-containing protein [Burkholderiales bacterium]